MSSRVWLLLVGLALSLLIGGCAVPASASLEAAQAAAPVHATPAPESDTPDETPTLPMVEAPLAEAIEVPLAESATRPLCAQQAWLRSPHTRAPVGPVLDGPLRPPKAIG